MESSFTLSYSEYSPECSLTCMYKFLFHAIHFLRLKINFSSIVALEYNNNLEKHFVSSLDYLYLLELPVWCCLFHHSICILSIILNINPFEAASGFSFLPSFVWHPEKSITFSKFVIFSTMLLTHLNISCFLNLYSQN